ncbi:MAG: HAD-IA family hydrolase [Anaerolineales bacterium]|nr:HAD-IA family hydrolase [Anaerolineales bacterium]
MEDHSHLDPHRVKAIFFDIDGTLANTDDAYVRRLANTLRPFRSFFPEYDPTPSARWLVMSAETPINWFLSLLERMRLDFIPLPEADDLADNRERTSHGGIALIPGVGDLIPRLHAVYPLAIVTARGEAETHRFLEQFNLKRFFRVAVTSRTCRRSKPFPDPVLWAAGELDVNPHSCLMVGDTTVDIRSGRSAGAQTVGVLCGFGERAELENAGADVILDSTADLAEVLLGE